MTDWDQIIEYMQNAMLAVDQTQQVADELRNHTSSATLDEFRDQAQTLIKHLSTLQNVLDHQTAYTMDELVDVLSRFFSGAPAAYRRTKHIDF
jgi:hypothetical protein